MHKLKSYMQGQNLVEIAIILALIVVVGIVALNILGFEVKDLFSTSHTKYEAYEPFKWGNSNSSGSSQAIAIKAGQLNGTPNKPVSQCSGGMCSIDYGTFVLNSIPENFNEYVQTGGTSGEDITLEPNSPYLYISYLLSGNAKSQDKLFIGAIDDYSQAIKLKPNDANLYRLRGSAKSNSNDLNGAIEDYSQAIMLEPDSSSSYRLRGSAKSNSNDLNGAIEDYSQAIMLEPDSSSSYRLRGLAKKALKDFTGANEDFAKARSLS